MPSPDYLESLGNDLMRQGLYLQLFCSYEREGRKWRCLFKDEGTDVIIVYEKHADLMTAINQALAKLASLPSDKKERTLHAAEFRQRDPEEPPPVIFDEMN